MLEQAATFPIIMVGCQSYCGRWTTLSRGGGCVHRDVLSTVG